MNHECQNCHSPLEEHHRYCPECGQKTTEKLTIGVLFSNTISNYFSVDSRFFVSFIPLLFRPGYLPGKFVEGKRMRYLHPAQFYLFISVIFFFLFSLQTRKQQENFDKVLEKGFESGAFMIDSGNITLADSTTIEENLKTLEDKGIKVDIDSSNMQMIDSIVNEGKKDKSFSLSSRTKKLDSLIAIGASQDKKLMAIGLKEGDGIWKQRLYMQLLKVYERRGGGLLGAFYDSIPIAMFFLLPLFALILKLLFFRKGLFAHHLVFSFYYFSFLFTVFSILILANFIYPVPDWLDWTLILMTGVYLLLAIKHFYGQGYFVSVVKTGVLTFMYLMFVLPMALVVLAIISFMVY
jgi:hypothetical protein